MYVFSIINIDRILVYIFHCVTFNDDMHLLKNIGNLRYKILHFDIMSKIVTVGVISILN